MKKTRLTRRLTVLWPRLLPPKRTQCGDSDPRREEAMESRGVQRPLADNRHVVRRLRSPGSSPAARFDGANSSKSLLDRSISQTICLGRGAQSVGNCLPFEFAVFSCTCQSLISLSLSYRSWCTYTGQKAPNDPSRLSSSFTSLLRCSSHSDERRAPTDYLHA